MTYLKYDLSYHSRQHFLGYLQQTGPYFKLDLLPTDSPLDCSLLDPVLEFILERRELCSECICSKSCIAYVILVHRKPMNSFQLISCLTDGQFPIAAD